MCNYQRQDNHDINSCIGKGRKFQFCSSQNVCILHIVFGIITKLMWQICFDDINRGFFIHYRKMESTCPTRSLEFASLSRIGHGLFHCKAGSRDALPIPFPRSNIYDVAHSSIASDHAHQFLH